MNVCVYASFLSNISKQIFNKSTFRDATATASVASQSATNSTRVFRFAKEL